MEATTWESDIDQEIESVSQSLDQLEAEFSDDEENTLVPTQSAGTRNAQPETPLDQAGSSLTDSVKE